MTALTRRPGRAGVALVLALIVLVVLTATVWAAWGAPWRGGLGALLEAHLTATPTRTPRPVTATPTLLSLDLAIVMPTATPPPPAPTAAPQAASAAPAQADDLLPAHLAAVVERYGMDPARRFVVVDLDAQTMTVWDPGQPLREMPVSTGDETRGYRTPAWYGLVGKFWGTFHAFGVYADDGWYLFEDTGSILVHGAPYKLVDGRNVYENLDALGSYPASRGCIRLTPEDASWFTAWGPGGVPLVILPKSNVADAG
ncbi:MAG: hypothetical protein CVU38_08935 [Chloroflexi bacterium HGW-Chloroflexi-1]|nr:MAG: hypothetical protein CVU38_08935 [Chloroflexi bacterium HGW-Chloroflexi-1]